MTTIDIHIYTVGKRSNHDTIECTLHVYNESTAGAGASVEVSKLHNIKLLAISNSFILTHIIIMNNFAILLHALIVRQNPESQRNSKSG